MPQPSLPTVRQYYWRLSGRFLQDLLRLGREQVIGLLLAVMILFFQIHYRVIPHALDWQAVKSVGWPYAIVAAVLSVLAMVRAPVGMDTDLRAEVESLKKQIVELTEAQRIIYDFRLHLAIPVQYVRMPVRFNLSNENEVEVPAMSITIWNKGKQHFQVAACHLTRLSPNKSKKVIKADLTVQPTRPEELSVTRPLLELLSGGGLAAIHWEELFGYHVVEIMIECRTEREQQSAKGNPKCFDVEVKKTGRMALNLDILPHA